MENTVSPDELIEDFALLDDWEDRYRYIIELGRGLSPLSQDEYSDVYKVKGCTSQVWLVPEVIEATPPRFQFRGDSDAHIVKGLVALIVGLYSGKTAEEMMALDIRAVFDQLGLAEHLSPNRRNGFFAMVDRIQDLAAASE